MKKIGICILGIVTFIFLFTSRAEATVHVAMMDEEYLQLQRDRYEDRLEKEREAAKRQREQEEKKAEEKKAASAEESKANAKAGEFTKEEIELLCKICHVESRGESTEGQMAVANVIINRVKSSKFPNTIKGVIFQKGQFTPAAKSSFSSIKPSSQVRKSVQRVIDGERVLSDDALYFKSTSSSAKWGSYTLERKIGRHLFYTD